MIGQVIVLALWLGMALSMDTMEDRQHDYNHRFPLPVDMKDLLPTQDYNQDQDIKASMDQLDKLVVPETSYSLPPSPENPMLAPVYSDEMKLMKEMEKEFKLMEKRMEETNYGQEEQPLRYTNVHRGPLAQAMRDSDIESAESHYEHLSDADGGDTNGDYQAEPLHFNRNDNVPTDAHHSYESSLDHSYKTPQGNGDEEGSFQPENSYGFNEDYFPVPTASSPHQTDHETTTEETVDLGNDTRGSGDAVAAPGDVQRQDRRSATYVDTVHHRGGVEQPQQVEPVFPASSEVPRMYHSPGSDGGAPSHPQYFPYPQDGDVYAPDFPPLHPAARGYPSQPPSAESIEDYHLSHDPNDMHPGMFPHPDSQFYPHETHPGEKGGENEEVEEGNKHFYPHYEHPQETQEHERQANEGDMRYPSHVVYYPNPSDMRHYTTHEDEAYNPDLSDDTKEPEKINYEDGRERGERANDNQDHGLDIDNAFDEQFKIVYPGDEFDSKNSQTAESPEGNEKSEQMGKTQPQYEDEQKHGLESTQEIVDKYESKYRDSFSDYKQISDKESADVGRQRRHFTGVNMNDEKSLKSPSSSSSTSYRPIRIGGFYGNRPYRPKGYFHFPDPYLAFSPYKQYENHPYYKSNEYLNLIHGPGRRPVEKKKNVTRVVHEVVHRVPEAPRYRMVPGASPMSVSPTYITLAPRPTIYYRHPYVNSFPAAPAQHENPFWAVYPQYRNHPFYKMQTRHNRESIKNRPSNKKSNSIKVTIIRPVRRPVQAKEGSKRPVEKEERIEKPIKVMPPPKRTVKVIHPPVVTPVQIIQHPSQPRRVPGFRPVPFVAYNQIPDYDPSVHDIDLPAAPPADYTPINGTRRSCFSCDWSKDKPEASPMIARIGGWKRCIYAFHHDAADTFGITEKVCHDNCYIRVAADHSVYRGCFRGEEGVDPSKTGCHKQGTDASVYCFCHGPRCNNYNAPEFF